MNRLLLCLLPLWMAVTPVHALTGDVARGEVLHKKCLDCHGTGVYAPALNDQEVEDITAWLNANFYKF